MTEPKLRAGIYARVSTEEQVDGTSLDEQVRLCTAEIERRGWSLDPDHIYIDAGISGADPTRPAWRKLLAAAASGEVEAVVVLKLDRFARNAGAIITETDRFQKLGVGFVVVEQGIDMRTMSGRMMRTVLAGVAEMERDLIAGRTVSGQRARAREGIMPGGTVPYGWRRNPKNKGGDGKLVPHEGEREVLRLAYEKLVKQRWKVAQFVNWLNDSGYEPRKSPTFRAEHLRSVLNNETLSTGKMIWGMPKGSGSRQRLHKTRLDTKGKPVHGDPIEVEIGNPVFTKAEHRAILRVLAQQASSASYAEAKSRMLTGRIYTPEGHRMYSLNSPDKKWLGYYRCSTAKKRVGEARCTCKQLRALPIEQLVWAEVTRLLSDPARLQAAARAYLALPEDDSDANTDRRALEGVRGEAEKLERALTRAERGVLMADSSEDEQRQQAMVADLKRELVAARERLAGYEALIASDEARGQALRDVTALAERARGRLHTMSDEERAEVVGILRISVVTSGTVVQGAPETVAISGIVDPQLWAGAETETLAEAPAPPQSPGRVAPKPLEGSVTV